MPKAVIEFSLPEEQEAFDDATQGSSWKYALFEFDQENFRNPLKHGDLADDTRAILEALRDKLYKKMEEEGLSFD